MLLTGGLALHVERRHAASTAPPTASSCSARGGRIVGRYDKAHLVPYGEYLPMRPLLSAIGLSRLAPGDLDFAPGPGPRTIDLGRTGARSASSSATRSSSRARWSTAHNRPDFIFNPSNDAWFGRWGPPQHLAQARLRAAEEGLPVIRSTPTGISAVIDARGTVVESAPVAAGRRDRRRAAAAALVADPVRPLRQHHPAGARLRCCSSRPLRLAAAPLEARHIKTSFISCFPQISAKDRPAFHAQLLPLHVRIRFRRPSRQGRRPDQRRDRRPVPVARTPRRASPARR